jgi:hypothetical protein
MHVSIAKCHDVAHRIIPSKDVPGCVLKAPTYSPGSILNWRFTCIVIRIIPMHEQIMFLSTESYAARQSMLLSETPAY